MRSARFVLWFALVPLTLASVARADEQREVVVPTESCGDFFFVPITLAPREGAPEDAESRTLRLLYDTGAARTIVDPDALERVTGRRVEPGTRVNIIESAAGPVAWNRLVTRVRELDHLGEALNIEFDGILGYGAFDDVLVTLDYPKREMRVALGELPRPDGREVFAYRGRERPFLRLEAGGRTRDILIDSGSSGELSLNETRGMDWLTEPIPISAAMRIDRLQMRRVGRLDDDVTIGPLIFDDPVTALTDGTQLIGVKLLRHMSLTFDQRNRRVRMIPAAQGPVRLEPVRGVGASYRPRGAALEVVHLLEGGPADRAGVRIGDTIYAIDGVPLADMGCLRQQIRDPAGDAWRVSLLRDGEAMEIEVAIETLVP